MILSFRKLFFRGEVGSWGPGVSESELRRPSDAGKDGGVAVLGVEMAAGLVEDSGGDVVACSSYCCGFDAFAE